MANNLSTRTQPSGDLNPILTLRLAASLFIKQNRFFGFFHWLRHYTKSRKVTGSIPDEVIEIFSIFLILPAAIWP
jgi:hypothetical protein